MKRFLPFLMLLGFFTPVKADHITGGEMYYSFIGLVSGQYNYRVTLKLSTDCDSRRRVDNTATVAIFNRLTGTRIRDISVNMSTEQELNLFNPDPCITNPPVVCYRVSYFVFDLTLPGIAEGYILTSQVNYRVNGLANLIDGYSNIGASYSAEIPGTQSLSNAPENNSAVFTGSDLVIICADHSFNYSFAAEDADGDQLIYSFCDAQSTNAGGGGNILYPAPPPFPALPYGSQYGGSMPLGSSVHINSQTGLITGIAPPEGKYVVTVCVQEMRNNVVIATQRKDIQIKIASCSVADAVIPEEYMLCKESKTVNLVNYSTSPLINSYKWDIRDAGNNTMLTSTDASVNYTFANAGTYTVRIYINPGQTCSDSAVSLIRVYPGFVPDFDFTGICAGKPTYFKDRTTSAHGNVNSWSWDFGRQGTDNNTSIGQNPSYIYPLNGTSNVRLIAGNDVGCLDTVYRQIAIVDKPPISLAFRDTLICLNDRLQLQASGSGNLTWGPAAAVNQASGNPIVAPSKTITYYVALDDNGCRNNDSVRVRVVDHVSVTAMNDTTICQGDTIRLRAQSDGLQYIWSPGTQLVNAGVKDPIAVTRSSTTYTIRAIIGGCSSTEDVEVMTAPYPLAFAGRDTTVCFNTRATLHGSTNGNSIVWSPANLLTNARTSDPETFPPGTTTYILSGFDSLGGCPKPGKDSVTVFVKAKIRAFAGNDTSVLIKQPLNLKATGGARYLWLPSTGLSASDLGSPVGYYTSTSAGIHYKVLVYDDYNCVDSAYVSVKVFNAVPSVFVPNAFTPNNDGKNDHLRPIPVGILRIDQFYIYNRWGQLIYSSTDTERGWDGTLSGKPQASDAYMWAVKAVDYNGQPYVKKGSFVLIR